MAEASLELSDRAYRLLVDAVVDYAIYLLDPEGRISSWNKGGQHLKGYAPAEVIGRHVSIFYTEEEQAHGVPEAALEAARRDGRFETEGWRVRRDGSRFWALVVIDVVRDDTGQMIGFAKITRDMTERQQAQQAMAEMREQLFRAEKLKALGQLTGGIAHDFNNLLQAISGGIALLERRLAPDERVGTILAEMRQAATRGAGLTRQLLAFSRRAPDRPEVIDTAARLRQSAEFFAHTLRGDIRVRLEVAEDPWPVLADPAQLELALLNVAVNARDAMPRGGELTVAARNLVLAGAPEGLEGRFVAIRLRDDGEGIPREVLGRVFEPFFTTKPLGKGTGLGLSQVYGFAQQAGGHVSIASEPGRGTEVTLLLPAAPEGEAVAKGPVVLPSTAVLGRGVRILVVDDDVAVGRLAASMLREEGCRVEFVAGPEAALECLEVGEPFDLVLSDVLMPGGMNGLELGREIRRRWPRLPVLLATGYAGEMEIDGREFPVLNKPFGAGDLTRALAGLLARHGHRTP